jgi:Helicase conserved C-terminal domain/HIRAN domain
LQNGIGVHFGNLPDPIRNAVESDFRQRKLRVLVATNTLAQGVNLPVKTVIMHSCWRWNQDARERITARDYWNIAGRAGRAGEETEGLVIHIKVNPSDQADFNYYSQRKNNVEPVRSALYAKVIALVQNRLSEEALKADLDPEIMAMVAEEGLGADTPETVASILDASLVRVQAKRDQYRLNPLRNIMLDVAREITETIDDPNLLSAFGATGLSYASCHALYADIRNDLSGTRRMLLGSGPDQVLELITQLTPICSALSEMQPSKAFGGSYIELLTRWIEGVDTIRLVKDFGPYAQSVEAFGRFLDDFVRYRLPWGVSAYIRIACSILGIDETELPEAVSSFPAMIKFGVPDTPACWAMSAGIPFRRTAIQMSLLFQRESSEQNHAGFLRWLSTLTPERLHHDLHLAGPVLEDVSWIVLHTSGNPLLRRFERIERFLPREVEIQGIKYEQRAQVAALVRPGAELQLKRDYENGIDRNAILVRFHSQDVGYIPRDVAQVIAPEMDTGLKVTAVATKVIFRRIPQVFAELR